MELKVKIVKFVKVNVSVNDFNFEDRKVTKAQLANQSIMIKNFAMMELFYETLF